jgi:hypothetical protein
VAVCRRALASLCDQYPATHWTPVFSPMPSGTAKGRPEQFRGSLAPGQSRCLATHYHQYSRTAYIPPYEAGEHWRHCAIRPAGARQGLSSCRLGTGCSVSCTRTMAAERSKEASSGAPFFGYFLCACKESNAPARRNPNDQTASLYPPARNVEGHQRIRTQKSVTHAIEQNCYRCG